MEKVRRYEVLAGDTSQPFRLLVEWSRHGDKIEKKARVAESWRKVTKPRLRPEGVVREVRMLGPVRQEERVDKA